MKYIIILLTLCACQDTRYYLTSDFKEGIPVTDDYNIRFKQRALFFENTERTNKHGYSLKDHAFFTQYTFRF